MGYILFLDLDTTSYERKINFWWNAFSHGLLPWKRLLLERLKICCPSMHAYCYCFLPTLWCIFPLPWEPTPTWTFFQHLWFLWKIEGKPWKLFSKLKICKSPLIKAGQNWSDTIISPKRTWSLVGLSTNFQPV